MRQEICPYGLVPKAGRLKVSYQDPRPPLGVMEMLGLMEISSMAQIDDDWQTRQAKSAQYICRFLGIMGEDLQVFGTTAPIKSIYKVLRLRFGSVTHAWAIGRINSEAFVNCRLDTLLGRASRWYYASFQRRVLEKQAPEDTARLEAGVEKIFNVLGRFYDFNCLMDKSEYLPFGQRKNPEARRLAEEHIVLIEQFPIAEGASRLASAGIDVLSVAIQSLGHTEGDEARALTATYIGFIEKLQSVIDLSDESATDPEFLPQAQRDAEHIGDFVDRRRLAIARTGRDWVLRVQSIFPMVLGDSARPDLELDTPQWVTRETERLTGGLSSNADTRAAQLLHLRLKLEGDDEFIDMTRKELHCGPTSKRAH
ncbi:hypothetical protein LTR95_008585 [Oleoguttula sp. CCFEE 5521]